MGINMYYVPKVSSLMATPLWNDGGMSVDKHGTTIMRDTVFLESKKLCRLALPAMMMYMVNYMMSMAT